MSDRESSGLMDFLWGGLALFLAGLVVVTLNMFSDSRVEYRRAGQVLMFVGVVMLGVVFYLISANPCCA